MKHIEIAKAWLNGETVQMKVGDYWSDMPDAVSRTSCAAFCDSSTYRIKPKTIITNHGREFWSPGGMFCYKIVYVAWEGDDIISVSLEKPSE